MSHTPRLLLVGLVAFAAIALSGCSTSAPADEAGTDTSAGSSASAEPAEASGGDFCADIEAAGGNGASFSTIPFYGPKESIVEPLESALAVLAVTPPDEIAEPWAALKDFDERALAEVSALAPGASLDDPALLSESADFSDEGDTITDYYFANC